MRFNCYVVLCYCVVYPTVHVAVVVIITYFFNFWRGVLGENPSAPPHIKPSIVCAATSYCTNVTWQLIESHVVVITQHKGFIPLNRPSPRTYPEDEVCLLTPGHLLYIPSDCCYCYFQHQLPLNSHRFQILQNYMLVLRLPITMYSLYNLCRIVHVLLYRYSSFLYVKHLIVSLEILKDFEGHESPQRSTQSSPNTIH